MRSLYVALICICAGVAGYYNQLQQKKILQHKITMDLLKSEQEPPKRSLVYALSVIAEKELKSRGVTPNGPSAIEKAIEHLNLSERDQVILRALGTDEVGRKFGRILIAEKHTSDLPGSEQFLSDFYSDLKNNPSRTLANAQTILERTPVKGYPAERAALLSLMDNAHLNTPLVRARSLEEFTQNIVEPRPDPNTAKTTEELNQALSVTPEILLPITAHSIFLKNTNDPREALRGTIRGIVTQLDSGIRVNMANQLIAQHPELKNDLHQLLSENNIHLPRGDEK